MIWRFQHSALSYILITALLAITYFVAGYFGLMLAVPPGFASPIWPPSGICLAIILLYGYRYWPGILIGSFLLNLTVSPDTTSLQNLTVAALIASGASIQAVFSAWMIKRFVSFPTPLEQPRDIWLVLMLGGPIGCLINSIIGVTSLTWIGVIPMKDYVLNWGTWWIGDTIGILVFTPFVIISLCKSPLVSLSRKFFVILSLMVAFGLTLALFNMASRWENTRQKALFEERATGVYYNLKEQLKSYVDILHSIERLYAASNFVSREEFSSFAAPLMAKHPGILGLSWGYVVPHEKREAFEKSQRAEGFESFSIGTIVPGKGRVVMPEHEEYYPVEYIEPDNPVIHGYDNRSEPMRRTALEKAWETEKPQATGRISIIQKEKDTYGMLIFQPILTAEPETGYTRRGFATGAFLIPNMINASLSATNKSSGFDIILRDEDAPTDVALLYDSRTPDKKEGAITDQALHPDSLSMTRTLHFAGREWTVQFMVDHMTLSHERSWSVWLVLTAGLIFTGLAGLFVLLITGHTDTIQRLVEQKTHEIGLREKTLRNAMENSPIGMALVSIEGKWLRVNEALCEILGYNSEELMELDFQSITHPDDLEKDLEQVRLVLNGRIKTYQMEKRYRHKHGHMIWALLSVSLIREHDGSPGYFVSQIQDITERKKMETMKNEFISTVSHELRTPLTSIRGALGLIDGGAAGELPEKAANLISIAHANSNRLINIINDILDIEKIEAGKMELKIDEIKALPLLQQILSGMENYAQSNRITYRLATNLKEEHILADANRLTQVLNNLLSNAAKFSHPGGEVILEAIRSDDAITIKVIDHGIGIAKKHHTTLFQKFTQVDSSTTRKYDGTGLGLTIVKKLLESMHSQIRFESDEGKGTTFIFELPLSESFRTSSAGYRTASTNKGRVLVCDDDELITEMLKRLLTMKGYEVDTAHNLPQVQRLLDENEYLCLTLDLMLPMGNGADLIEELRMEVPSKNLPIMVISARATKEKARFADKDMGAISWANKPLSPAKFLLLFEELISHKQRLLPRILYASKQPRLAGELTHLLAIDAQIITANHEARAQHLLHTQYFDLVIFDVAGDISHHLETLNCADIKHNRHIPVIVLSESDTPQDITDERVANVMLKSTVTKQEIATAIETILTTHPLENGEA